MADNFVERVQELFKQNFQKEAAELLKSTFDENTELKLENTELKSQLAESKILLEGATKTDNFVTFSRTELAEATSDFDHSAKIAEGSYGAVYRGVVCGSTTVAIKVLKEDGPIVPDREFNQVIEVLGKIRHKHLVSLIGASPEAGALVYDYLPNGSLKTYLFDGNSKNTVTWRDRLRIASEICSALNFLHSQDIAHGDLNPENVLLDSDLTSKLSDFGLSRKLKQLKKGTTSLMHRTEKPKMNGSSPLAYIDPVFYYTGEMTAKSDVFSFGIILLQFVTGNDAPGLRSLVARAAYENNLDKHVDKSAKWPLNEAFKLAELGLKCSERSRSDRPDSSTVYQTIKTIKNDASTNKTIKKDKSIGSLFRFR